MISKTVERISTSNMSHSQWLLERSKSIGGSDAAAIVGMSPWVTPYSLWCEKTGKTAPKEDNEAMRQGRDLEQYVADRWQEATGKKVRRLNAILKSAKYPWAHANIDRDVVGENAGLECKTTSIMQLKKFKNGEYPEQYYAQCVHYMAVTGADRWYLAVLVLNQGFYHFTIERDQAEIDALMAAEQDFWSKVENNTPPAVDGREPTTKALSAEYSDPVGATVELFGREPLLAEWDDLREQKNAIDLRLEEIKQIFMSDLGVAETGICGERKIRWPMQSKRTFDAGRFSEDHPDMDLEPYFKTSQFRKFEIRRK